jgi:hypothetical protein
MLSLADPEEGQEGPVVWTPFLGNWKITCISVGTYKVRNEIETKRNEINENETKRNQRNGNEMKRNQRKQNEIDWYEENGRKKIKDKTK